MYYEGYGETERDGLYLLTGGESGQYWDTETARARLSVLWAVAPILRRPVTRDFQGVAVIDWKDK